MAGTKVYSLISGVSRHLFTSPWVRIPLSMQLLVEVSLCWLKIPELNGRRILCSFWIFIPVLKRYRSSISKLEGSAIHVTLRNNNCLLIPVTVFAFLHFRIHLRVSTFDQVLSTLRSFNKQTHALLCEHPELSKSPKLYA